MTPWSTKSARRHSKELILSFLLVIVGLVVIPGGIRASLSVLSVIRPFTNSVQAAVASGSSVIVGGKFQPGYIDRISSDGSSDKNFFSSNISGAFNGAVTSMVSDGDAGAFIAGEFTSYDDQIVGGIAHILSDGTIDRSFAQKTGTGFDGKVQKMVKLADGRLVITGEFTSFNGTQSCRIALLSPSGELDANFRPDCKVTGRVNVIAATAEGDGILLAGRLSVDAQKSRPWLVMGWDGQVVR